MEFVPTTAPHGRYKRTIWGLREVSMNDTGERPVCPQFFSAPAPVLSDEMEFQSVLLVVAGCSRAQFCQRLVCAWSLRIPSQQAPA